MTTTIHRNGSKWAGEAPDSIDTLLHVLSTDVLDRRFEIEGETGAATFIEQMPGIGVRFFGNFLTVSHVFQIDTNEPAVIDALTAAIALNVARPEYQAQASAKQRREADEAHRRARDGERQAQREADARRVLGLEA